MPWKYYRDQVVRPALGALPLSILLVAAWSHAPPPVAAAGAHHCECVEYVKTVLGLRGAAGNAKEMGRFLAAHGFRRAGAPLPGDVVIVQPGYYAHGAAALYGHAAIIIAVSRARGGAWLLTVRGANQTGASFTAAGCNDVSVKQLGPFAPNSHLVAYWRPPAP